MLNSLGRYLRRHHVAFLALFFAMAGTSYAVTSLPAGSVGTRQLKRHAVTLAKINSTTVRRLRGRRGPRGLAGKTGDRGPAGTAKGYGTVFTLGNGKTASLVDSSPTGIKLTHPSTGYWCLTVPGADPAKERAIVSLSSVANYNAAVSSGFLSTPQCPSTAFRVVTDQVTSLSGNGTGTPSDEPFEFLIP